VALASAQQTLAQPVAVPAATKRRQQEMYHLKKLGFLGSKYPITFIMPVCRFSTEPSIVEIFEEVGRASWVPDGNPISILLNHPKTGSNKPKSPRLRPIRPC